jgi:hypothetical protein
MILHNKLTRVSNSFLYLLLSILLHLLLLLQVKKSSEPIHHQNSKKINIIVLEKAKKIKVIAKKKKLEIGKLTLSMLGLPSNKVDFAEYEVDSSKNISVQKNTLLFNTINKYLKYPNELVRSKIQGHVSAKFYLDKNGKYDESKSQINSNSVYLRVHIARLLRKSLEALDSGKLKLKKLTQFNASFQFKLTTTKNEKDTSQIFDNNYFFYRQKYGVSNKGDVIVKGIGKSLIHLTNWLSLLEYAPDSDKAMLQKGFKLKSYENDLFY